MEEQQNQETHRKNWHDRHYKHLLIIPLVLLLFSLVYLGIFHSKNNDFFYKDISLTGGTSVTIYEKLNIEDLNSFLEGELSEVNLRKISDLISGEQVAIVVETTAESNEAREVLENYLGYELTEENSSFEFTGSSLSNAFYRQLIIALFVAFVFMAIVIFIIFKTPVPSGAVVLAAFADIIMTLVTVNILGIKMSSAGIISLLMLIGYSVDTDILLTNRVLRRHEGTLNEKLMGSVKTGLTMTLTSLVAVTVALLVVKSFSETLNQIFTILLIGLIFDMLNTWITNVSILKWYVERKK